jgi:hypothetical protein
MNDSEINDCRPQKDFSHLTFSKFSRRKVKNELLQTLYKGDIEPACFWSVELICAGHLQDLWDVLLLYMSRNIHVGNPKLPIYMEMRFQNFKNIVENILCENELSLRNNNQIRKLFAELICILCCSRKKHAFESLAIKNLAEFDVTNITSKLKAPNISYVQKIYEKEDPKELFIAINEFAYNISEQSKDITSACYWIEWILQFETISNKKKIACSCERRVFAPVYEKYQMDIIWLLWDALLLEASAKKKPVYSKIIKALLNLYCIKYKPSLKKKRKYIIYSAVSFLTENLDLNLPLVANKEFIENITSKINIIYKEVKKNENAPTTDYLFTGIQQRSNTEKTIEKLEKFNMLLNK